MNILLDIGGTKMRITAASGGDAFVTPHIVDTPATGDEALRVIASNARELANDNTISGVYAGVRAYDRITGTLRDHPRLPMWEGFAIRDALQKNFNTTVVIENDAAVVGLGEAVCGAGKGRQIVAYLTISTGVGGAKIVDGRIDENAIGFEPGAEIVDGTHTLEELISGSAIESKYGMSPKDITNPKIWEELAHFLAIGVNNAIVHWSPDCVVLGGSMMNEVGIPLPLVEESLSKMLTVYGACPPIVHASLGDLGGLYGALALSRQS